MLRDDISYKLTELLHAQFTHIGWDCIHEDANLQKDLDLDAIDIMVFADTILVEFDLDEIEFSSIMEWVIVKDIVDYLEDNLKKAVGEEE